MNPKYDLILFDLDGTLSQSHEGVKASLIYALKKLGEPIPPQIDNVSLYVGPPLMDTFENMCGLSHKKSLAAIEFYREIYDRENKYKNKCYGGIKEVLAALKNNGAKLGVATTKFEPAAEEVLKTIGILDYFDIIGGSSGDGKIENKTQVVTHTVNRFGMELSNRIVLIGDSKFDAEGAKLTGIDFIGVLYGYGSKEDMLTHGASVFADSPEELLPLLLD